MRYCISTIVVLICFVVLFAGCAPRYYYSIGLDEVEISNKEFEIDNKLVIEKRYDTQKIIEIEEKGIEKYSFEDEIIKIVWKPEVTKFSFVLTNKTDKTILIIWDKAMYIDENGEKQKVMGFFTKYYLRYNAQKHRVIRKKSTIKETIHPVNKVFTKVVGGFGGGKAGGGGKGSYEDIPLFPIYSSSFKRLKVKPEDNIGKTVKFILPLKTGDITNKYIFTFAVKDIELK
ncbi:MAG: hypothetical protein ABH868_03420 [bacterium]